VKNSIIPIYARFLLEIGIRGERLMKSKYIKIFITFFKIGLFTIGGGLAMIPVIRDEFVVKNKWVDDKDIADIFAVAQSLPGVIAINSSIYVGYRIAGIIGAVIAAVGVILPSFIIIYIIYLFFTPEIARNPYLEKAFKGINGGITGLILSSAITMAKVTIKNIFTAVTAVISFLLVHFIKLEIGVVVLISAVLGYLYYKTMGYVKKDKA
jgi:chromate transporter